MSVEMNIPIGELGIDLKEPEKKPQESLTLLELRKSTQEFIDKIVRESDRRLTQLEEEYRKLLPKTETVDNTASKKFQIKSEESFLSMRKIKSKFANIALLLIPLIFIAPTFKPESKSKPLFSNRAVAAEQLKNNGITDDQKSAYNKGISELLYEGIIPVGYKSLWGILKYLPNNLLENDLNNPANNENAEKRSYYKKHCSDREDAWRLYLGLPQKNNTFGISEYKPVNSEEDKYYYQINNWFEKFSKELPHKDHSQSSAIRKILVVMDEYQYSENKDISDSVLVEYIDKNSILANDNNFGSSWGVMGDYKISLGQDERGSYISYYDIWNLEGSIEGEEGLLGKPFEIYDRIYYDPVTFEPIGK